MPRVQSTGRQAKPKGDVLTPTSDERKAVRVARELKTWTTTYVAKKIGVSQGTISNIETGAHTKQVRRDVWLKLVRLLKMDTTNENPQREKNFKEIAERLPLLSPETEEQVLALLRAMTTTKI